MRSIATNGRCDARLRYVAEENNAAMSVRDGGGGASTFTVEAYAASSEHGLATCVACLHVGCRLDAVLIACNRFGLTRHNCQVAAPHWLTPS
jgi:hypothetical protein